MSKQILCIYGRIVNQTGRGVPNFRIEAWDKDLIFNDLVGSAITDVTGNFQIEFSQAYFRECFLDRQPDLFFKVYRGSQLIKSTEDSVLWNVAAGETPVTITIETSPNQQPQQLIVRGQIFQTNQNPLAQAVVRAFDRDLRREQLLGETVADEEGRYEILYTREQFRRAEKKTADLIVRAFDPDIPDLLLGESDTIFNAQPIQTINLIVSRVFSEYERYIATLNPLRENVPIADLTPEDITFLAHETNIPTQHLEFLVTATQLGKQTQLPSEVFYGFARQNLPTTLSDLLDRDIQLLRQALTAALEANIIPSRLQAELDKIIEQLQQLAATDPGIQLKAEQAKLRHLGEAVELDTAKIEAVLKKVHTPAVLSDRNLIALVETNELQEQEAKDLGLIANLSNLLDENISLASAVKQGEFPQIPNGRVERIKDLISLDRHDWATILEQTGAEPPDGLNRENYAQLLAKRIENLYPSNTLLARVSRKIAHERQEEISNAIARIKPLLEQNEAVCGVDDFDSLQLSDVGEEEKEQLRQAHTQLKRLAKTYPGLRLNEILDNREAEAKEKLELVRGRVQLLSRFEDQNPDVEFLSLDYAPESKDIEALNFEGISSEEKQMLLGNLKAYQRSYTITKDSEHTTRLLEQGYHSAFSIRGLSSNCTETYAKAETL